MSAIWNIITTFLVTPFKSRETLLLEILVLRQQLIVLQRKTPKRAKFKRTDRLIFAWLYRIRPEILASIRIVKPETIVRWHKKGFGLFWRWKSQHRGSGRPRIDKDLRALICQMCRENPLWGVPTKNLIRASDRKNRGMITLDDRYLETLDVSIGRIVCAGFTT